MCIPQDMSGAERKSDGGEGIQRQPCVGSSYAAGAELATAGIFADLLQLTTYGPAAASRYCEPLAAARRAEGGGPLFLRAAGGGP